MTSSPARPPVRLVLCTSGGLYGALVMRQLMADPRVELAGVVLSSRLLRKEYGWPRGVWEHYRLSGLRYLLYLWSATGLAEILSRSTALRPVSAQAAAIDCPVHVTRDINDDLSRRFLDECAPQLLLSAFFNQRIGAAVYGRPGMAALNIHPSLLPELKGVDPVFYARLRKVSSLGVTLHCLASELDAGAIVAQSRLQPAEADSVLRTTARLFEAGARLVSEHLERIQTGMPGEPQPDGGAYDSWPTPAQVGRLRAEGCKLVAGSDLLAIARGWQ